MVVCTADTVISEPPGSLLQHIEQPMKQPIEQQTVLAPVKPTPKTVALNGLRPIFMQILGPVGRIMDVDRVANTMKENPTAFPLDRLDELLDRIAVNYRLNDTEKKAQITQRAHQLFGNSQPGQTGLYKNQR